MSAGNLISGALGGGFPRYFGACMTPSGGAAAAQTIPLNSDAALTSLTAQHGAAPVGMSRSAGGLLVANAGLYRARGALFANATANIGVAPAIMVGGVVVAIDPVDFSNGTATTQFYIDAIISLTAGQLVQLAHHNGTGLAVTLGAVTTRASLKLESLF